MGPVPDRRLARDRSRSAAATAASLLLYLGDIADGLDPDKEFAGITNTLETVEGGEPQTILILGSDKRPELKGDSFRGLSDTTMLLRVDPDRNAIALFSLPRDLRVDIPGYGTRQAQRGLRLRRARADAEDGPEPDQTPAAPRASRSTTSSTSTSRASPAR